VAPHYWEKICMQKIKNGFLHDRLEKCTWQMTTRWDLKIYCRIGQSNNYGADFGKPTSQWSCPRA